MNGTEEKLYDARFGDLKVLIVEESPHMVAMIGDLLLRFGFTSIQDVGDASQAQDLLLKTRFDLILCDLMAVDTDGLALARLIRSGADQTNQLTSIILMTAKADRETIFGARDAGVNEFIRKPFTAAELFKKVGAIIDNPRGFVSTQAFFGPDRRRRAADDFKDTERRKTEATIIDPNPR